MCAVANDGLIPQSAPTKAALGRFLGRALRLSRPVKRGLQVATDAVLMVGCFYLAMLLRLETVEFIYKPSVWYAFLPIVPLTILVFRTMSLYRAVLRYITPQVFQMIFIGSLFSASMLFVSLILFAAPIPRSVPGIYCVLLVITAGGLRFVLRDLFRRWVVGQRRPVVIYGAGASGRQLLNAIYHSPEYFPIAFIDDDPEVQKTVVSGKNIYAVDRLPQLIKNYGVQAVLLAVPNATARQRRDIISRCEPFGLRIKTVPAISEIISGLATVGDLRSVDPDDLLGRDPVPPRLDLMGRNIAGKIVMVSGAGGSIGSELCRQILQHKPQKLVLFEVSEFALYRISTELREAEGGIFANLIEPVLGSVQNAGRVTETLRAHAVQTIYHAAAYKHVVLVEDNIVEGVRNNVFGTRVLAEAARETQVESFILISTDKAVRPTNIMGATKRIAELVCQAMALESSTTVFSTVRFGNVLGSSGSVIPRFEAQIEQGGPVTVTHPDITRFFMTIPEAAQLVIQAGAMARGGDVFVLDMGQPVKIMELAKSIVRLKGYKPVLDDGQTSRPAQPGEIPIRVVGLQKGEKLYEELLIGNCPKPTDHPRIMTAQEVALNRDQLAAYLERLFAACERFDIETLRSVFAEMPLAYQPAPEPRQPRPNAPLGVQQALAGG